MRKIFIVAALIAAATAQAAAQDHGYSPSHGSRQSVVGDPRPLGLASGQSADGRVLFANAPGGAYIDCDPRNPSSPIRCKPDGW